MISFAGGNPDPAVFPVAEFSEASVILAREGRDVLQYGATDGYAPLKEYIAKWMAPRMGRETKPEEMLITTGSQEGMDLLCSVLLNDGDTIIVEGPTYPGAIHAMRNRGARFLTVPCDKDGLCVDLLPGIIEQGRKDGHKIKFIYTIVNFQNPSGSTLSEERRAKLLDIAEKYDLIIFEDDPYGHLRYTGKHVPTIFSMDKNRAEGSSRLLLLQDTGPRHTCGMDSRRSRTYAEDRHDQAGHEPLLKRRCAGIGL